MTTTATDGTNLASLIEKIELAPVTTTEIADARTVIERYAGDNAELTLFYAMAGIDDEGLAEGLERGVWVEA